MILIIQYPLIEVDGFTTKLIVRGSLLLQNEWNTIRLAIDDATNQILDSYLLISANINILSIIISIPIMILIGSIELISAYIISI